MNTIMFVQNSQALIKAVALALGFRTVDLLIKAGADVNAQNTLALINKNAITKISKCKYCTLKLILYIKNDKIFLINNY